MKDCVMVCLLFTSACGNPPTEIKPVPETWDLPILGTYEIVMNGDNEADTLYHRIPDFSFINQDGEIITNKDVENHIYLADFFFTSCPGICPKLATTLKLVHESLKSEPRFKILSHTIDPDYDTPKVLLEYADKQGADTESWIFLTGSRKEMYDICFNGYLAFAEEESSAPGGYLHSGFLVLVDSQRHIRAVYDGTRAELADSIVTDVRHLLLKMP